MLLILIDTCMYGYLLFCCEVRVDKGFVAQVADVQGGRVFPMNSEQEVRQHLL